MEPLLLRVTTAPVRLSSGTWLGAAAGGVSADAGSQDAEFTGSLELEPFALSVEEDEPNGVEVPVYGGDPRFYPWGRPRRRLAVDLSALDINQLRQLYRLLASGRALSVGAWHDDTTLWMSRFGGQAQDGELFVGVAEVGDCAAGQVVRRSTFDYSPTPAAGFNVMHTTPADAATNPRPKIVGGMVGTAISLGGARRNLAGTRMASGTTPAFTKFGGTVGGVNAGLRHNLVKAAPGEAYNIPWVTTYNDGIEIPSSAVTAGTTYTWSLYARGSGDILLAALNGFSVVAQAPATLTDDWQRFTVTFTAQGGQTAVRFRVYSSAGGASIQVSAAQLEVGNGPTDYLDTGTNAATPDAVVIRETLPASGFTMVFWLRHVSNNDIRMLFSTYLGAAGDVLAYLFQDTVTFQVGSTTTTRALPAGQGGQWMQLVLTFGGATSLGGSTTARIQVYANGQQLGGNVFGAGLNLYPAASTVHTTYLGSDAGSAAPAGYGLNTELDRFRLDGRIWTAAEVAADYRRLTDPGICGLLELVEGRYFRAGLGWAPRGPYLDTPATRLQLVEVAASRAGVY